MIIIIHAANGSLTVTMATLPLQVSTWTALGYLVLMKDPTLVVMVMYVVYHTRISYRTRMVILYVYTHMVRPYAYGMTICTICI